MPDCECEGCLARHEREADEGRGICRTAWESDLMWPFSRNCKPACEHQWELRLSEDPKAGLIGLLVGSEWAECTKCGEKRKADAGSTGGDGYGYGDP